MDRKKILIWGKTYPELSMKYKETVCTGGCTLDGKPIRIYPIPLRYLPDHMKYSLYSIIEVGLQKSASDRRPESYKVYKGEVKVIANLDTKRGWEERRRIIFKDTSWHYNCVEALKNDQRKNKTSLGFVKVGAIERIWYKTRTAEEQKQHEDKLKLIGSQQDLFNDDQIKSLRFLDSRVYVKWKCISKDCPGHSAGILDWGLGELIRKTGIENGCKKIEEITNLKRHDLHFFMGNFKGHPHNFGITAIWYPLIREVRKYPLQPMLFESL